ncbi:MAG: hypothetical protein FWE21_02950 [Defluviitaleaceae bacterium]|nr:hypothetical protein [Defluviitaleaceae bacterium]
MDNKAMEVLGAENADLLQEFVGRVQGKSMMELPGILMEFKARLPKDKVFTPQESEFIMEAAMAGLPEAEKNRYKSMLKILKI